MLQSIPKYCIILMWENRERELFVELVTRFCMSMVQATIDSQPLSQCDFNEGHEIICGKFYIKKFVMEFSEQFSGIFATLIFLPSN